MKRNIRGPLKNGDKVYVGLSVATALALLYAAVNIAMNEAKTRRDIWQINQRNAVLAEEYSDDNGNAQVEFKRERSFFLKCAENQTKVTDEKFEERSNILLQSIKKLFANKVFHSSKEDIDYRSLLFSSQGIFYTDSNGTQRTLCEFDQDSKDNLLSQFANKFKVLQDAINNQDVNGIADALGRKEDEITKILESNDIYLIQGRLYADKKYHDEQLATDNTNQ